MYNDYKVSDDLKSMMNNERIVWSGRPKKSCFVLECILIRCLFLREYGFFLILCL